MPKFLITTRRDKREHAKPAVDAVKGFNGISIDQVHTPEMVTVEGSEEAINTLREAISPTYHVEPIVKRGLD